ncbi:plasmid mobilization relaxosome protein MobC [Acetobacter thailandicus]|uniref:Plasmid mobilization relaxosome protein MobC n=1 Tax=Acetobacter thailandicus TaxID=1502842 RepID=A0ABT3QEJ2_9PROT|nr:plasmid mobilization relaxosome protein MobC [Acetobacter thailandicus]MCX2563698.1 plasmid mobilization relaxosome protein MobC [Acetobacter thailandicus]NHN95230.1 plasmid mobilization relaxosome protein MobC [Acetobacter thailandicus]
MATAQRDRFFIKLNPDEKAKWKKHAEEIGYNNISSMLREMVRESIASGTTGNELKDELLKIRREISAIGNNINQIAKHSNQTKTAHDIPDLSKIKKNIARVVQVMRGRIDN